MQRGLFTWITSGACRLLGQRATAEVGACPCVREHQEFAFVTFPWMQQEIEEVTMLLHKKLHTLFQMKVQPESTVLELPFVSSTQHFVKWCLDLKSCQELK